MCVYIYIHDIYQRYIRYMFGVIGIRITLDSKVNDGYTYIIML